ncbi:leucine rich repeat LRR-containing protein [Nitzschia inconspicua]|uniref:Leucine rich repeat LRR-containing protein n=1 Tax=Nitzschia inconspicua TaxID=303405 RepID=A0A9K3Q8E1_9STRA|nr:leucine rich repeat LRR-containing protein [Nitzschia inconspicua]
MRLFLHGRSQPSTIVQKLEMGYNNHLPSYTSLLLSNWNLDDTIDDVLDAVEAFVSKQATPDIILQNCKSDEPGRLEHLVTVLLNAAASQRGGSLTIRYDKQRNFPLGVAKGILLGAKQQLPTHASLHSLTLKGMTFTAETSLILQQALSNIPSLQELTIRGNFTLHEVDRRGCTIIGRQNTKSIKHLQEMECTIDIFYDILQGLPDLKILDLQQCHVPDEYLADLLEGLYPETLETLRLNGNMCGEESQQMLREILIHEQCALKELDLSWQRQPKASKNFSILPLGWLAKVLVKDNTSLETLNVSDNRLLDQDVAELAVALKSNISLQSIRMQNCRISTRGILALFHTLPHWSEQLKSVYVDGHQRVEKSSSTRRKIYQGLLENVYLKHLDLPDSCQSRRIAWVLELNKAGRRILLNPSELEETDASSSNSSSESSSSLASSDFAVVQDALWPTILERADRISRQEYLLEESCTNKGASAMFLLLREKGYQSLVR